jgi:hypothetical protein
MMSSCFKVCPGWLLEVERLLKKVVKLEVGFYMVKKRR